MAIGSIVCLPMCYNAIDGKKKHAEKNVEPIVSRLKTDWKQIQFKPNDFNFKTKM